MQFSGRAINFKMLAILLCEVFLLMHRCNCVRCPKRFQTNRNLERGVIEYPFTKIIYIASYSLISEIRPNENFSVKRNMMNHRGERLLFMAYNLKGRKYARFADAPTGNTLEFDMLSIEMSLNQVENSNCAQNTSQIEFYIGVSNQTKSDRLGITLLHACILSTAKTGKTSSVIVKQSVIILIEAKTNIEVDVENISSILSQQHQMIDLNYSFIDTRGFCVCNETADYINDCPQKPEATNDDENYLILSAICFAFLVSAVLYMIWSAISQLKNHFLE